MKNYVEFEVKKIIYRNKLTKYTVIEVKYLDNCRFNYLPSTENIIVGEFINPLEEDIYKAEGEFIQSAKYGWQLRVENPQHILPSTEKGLIKYINNTKACGKKTAEKLVEKYGLDTLNKIKEDINNLTVIKGISSKKAKAIYDSINLKINEEEVIYFLFTLNLGVKTSFKIFEKYGTGTKTKIMENPYILLDVENIGFKTADDIANSFNFKYNNKTRINNAILYFLKNEISLKGDLFTFKKDLLNNINIFLEKNGKIKGRLTVEEIETQLKELVNENKIKIEDDNCIYIRFYNYIENMLVKQIKCKIFHTNDIYSNNKINSFIENYEKTYNFIFADKQKQSIHMALTNGISILTGGPGTGKTQTINSIIKCIEYVNPKATIDLCAPTGKASKRMCELTGKEAMTIHRRLKLVNTEEDAELEPIESDFLIIDESSMIDAPLFLKVLENTSQETKIIVVGDHEQLPSVGAGLILRDLIKSDKIPVTKLDKIFRQAGDSKIATNAHKIISGKQDLDFGDDFNFIETVYKNNIQDQIIKVIEDLKLKGYKKQDIQVLTGMKNGDIGTKQLNNILQNKFNKNTKNEYQKGNKILRKGDRVIQTENNYDINVFNGSVGYIANIIGDIIEVDFDGEIKEYTDETIDQIELAYALTIHKSQGSEFPIVIIPVHSCQKIMNSRNLLYTAVTRAKEKVILIGEREEINYAINTITNLSRNSKIIEKLNK